MQIEPHIPVSQAPKICPSFIFDPGFGFHGVCGVGQVPRVESMQFGGEELPNGPIIDKPSN